VICAVDFGGWKAWAKRLKRDVYAFYLACHDPRLPWYVRAIAICVVAYAFSPIDLIPDFIPVLGYLDDLLIVPLGLALLMRLIPKAIFRDCQVRAEAAIAQGQGKPTNWVAAGVIIFIWLGLGIGLVLWLRHR